MNYTKYLATITIFLALGFSSNLVSAKKSSKAKTSQAIKALQEPFKFRMSKKKVLKLIIKEIKTKYRKKILKTRRATKKDEIRRKRNSVIKKLKKNVIKFNGKNKSWNTSIIDDQFAHKNYESAIAYIDKNTQKFFFFYKDKLYKIFISLNRNQFRGFNFAKFQITMEKAYGKSKEIFKKGIAGDTMLHHLLWEGKGNTELWAMDKTDVYGNFVFILIDSNLRKTVVKSRKNRGVKLANSTSYEVDPIVKTVTSGSKGEKFKEKKKKDK
ncbi:MAG: hypothetical protein ACQES9_02945 [Myxococcota bacterium]